MLYAFAYILSRIMIMNKTNKRGEGRASFVRHPVFLWRSRRLKLPSFCGPFCRQMHTDATATGCYQGIYRKEIHWASQIYISVLNRDWFPKFANGLDIKIDIVHKVCICMSDQGVFLSKWPHNRRIILAKKQLGHFYIFAYFDILPIRKFWESVSMW